MPSLTTPAIVLRAVSYGEADRIVTLFGRETGRLSALARGARKSQRRFSGGLGLCAVGTASLRERSGAELMTLEHFDVTDSHTLLGSDVALMAHAAYAAELVGKLCAPRQPEARVYDWLMAFLGHLEVRGANAERLRVFELGLLAGVGLAPVIDGCAICAGASYAGRSVADVAFRWDPDRGGLVCVACARGGRPMGAAARAALVTLAATPLSSAGEVALPPDVNRDCREALLEIITHHVAGPLKSVEFIAKVGRGIGLG
jgi:DNA repair protein RecO (recombination protein O)